MPINFENIKKELIKHINVAFLQNQLSGGTKRYKKDVAKDMGINVSYLSEILQGSKFSSMETYFKTLNYLGYDVNIHISVTKDESGQGRIKVNSAFDTPNKEGGHNYA